MFSGAELIDMELSGLTKLSIRLIINADMFKKRYRRLSKNVGISWKKIKKQ